MSGAAQASTRSCSLPPARVLARRAADSPLASRRALGHTVTGLLECVHPRTRRYVRKGPPSLHAQALLHRLSQVLPGLVWLGWTWAGEQHLWQLFNAGHNED